MDNNSEVSKQQAKSSAVYLFIAICGTFAAVFGLFMFNQHLLMSFSLPLRMILMIVTQWLLFLVPAVLMIVNKEKPGSIGLKKRQNSAANRHRRITCCFHVISFYRSSHFTWLQRNGRKYILYSNMEICFSVYLCNIGSLPRRRADFSRLYIQ